MLVQDIRAKHVAEAHFDESDFEDLVAWMLREEVRARCPGGEVLGPTKRKKADGGRDIATKLAVAPLTSHGDHGEALAWDEPGTTWYSCKVGTSWYSTGLSRDFKITQKNKAEKTAGTTGVVVGPKVDRPTRELLEHLSAGARYVVVTDQMPGEADQAKLDQIAKASEFWLRHEGLTVPSGLRGQFELIDANRIAAHLSLHRVNLPAQLRQQLQIGYPEGLESWEQWGEELRERGKPDYVRDPPRDSVNGSLRSTPQENLAIHIVGPPGVGKTRAAYEALCRLDNPSAQVMYTAVPDVGRRAVRGTALRGTHRIALVVDEVRSDDVEEIVTVFRANLRESLLVLIGTSDYDPHEAVPRGVSRIRLDQLTLEARRQLAADVLGVDVSASDAQLDSVVHLAEGYPLFIVKLAEALSADNEVLARGNDEMSRWDAAKRVLAGPKTEFGGNELAWDREAVVRAKCLLVVIMTGAHDQPWHQTWDSGGEALASAILEETDWERIRDAERACILRQILRRPDAARNYRYVSPRNLARIVLNHFVGSPDGGLAQSIAKHCPEYLERLLTVARDVQANKALERLATVLASELRQRASTDEPEAAMALLGSGNALYAAARVLPEVTAAAITDVLLGWSDDVFRSAVSARANARGTLEHLAHRKLGKELFSRVETALFRMASFEFEVWSNNSTGIWSGLFRVVLHGTHRSWDERVHMFRTRLDSTSAPERQLALRGLDAAMSADEQGLGHTEHDLADGPWPYPRTSGDIRTAKHEAWALVLDRTQDPEAAVAAEARKIVIDSLRGALQRGWVRASDGVLERLSSSSAGWSRGERTALRGCIEDVYRYDESTLTQPDIAALDELNAAIAPLGFGERLSSQVGAWNPGPLPIEAKERRAVEVAADDKLISEALATPDLLLRELEWLASDDAVRSAAFLQRLGARDQGQRFLRAIEERYRTQAGPSLLTPYLAGWGQAAGPRALEAWFDEHADDPCFAETSVAVLAQLRPDDGVLQRICGIIQRTEVPSRLLMPLRISIRGSDVGTAALVRLVAAMADSNSARTLRCRSLSTFCRMTLPTISIARSCCSASRSSRASVSTAHEARRHKSPGKSSAEFLCKKAKQRLWRRQRQPCCSPNADPSALSDSSAS